MAVDSEALVLLLEEDGEPTCDHVAGGIVRVGGPRLAGQVVVGLDVDEDIAPSHGP